MRFVPSILFEKVYKKLTEELRSKILERLKMFATDEFDPILNNHKLKYEYESFRSINITGDWRLIFRKISSQTVLLHRVGTHSQLFKK